MHVLGTTITDRVHTVIRRTVTPTVHTAIHTLGGIIPGLGTATVHTDIRTIGDQSIETKPTRPSTHRARPLISHSTASVENIRCWLKSSISVMGIASKRYGPTGLWGSDGCDSKEQN